MGNCPAGELLETTKEAKRWLLKDKIKARLEKSMGKQLDAMAGMAVDLLMGKIEMKKQKMQKKREMMERMKGMMEE